MSRKPSAIEVEDDTLLTMSAAAREVNKSQQSIKRWILCGILKAFRLPTGIYAVRRGDLFRVDAMVMDNKKDEQAK